mmetsp:Transcript_35359/g.69784  ORF Transcript_35359/g.69784 Transcript_35359/m.69784 type:complete len:183 (-) Transcript_35359:908-1456(-)
MNEFMHTVFRASSGYLCQSLLFGVGRTASFLLEGQPLFFSSRFDLAFVVSSWFSLSLSLSFSTDPLPFLPILCTHHTTKKPQEDEQRLHTEQAQASKQAVRMEGEKQRGKEGKARKERKEERGKERKDGGQSVEEEKKDLSILSHPIPLSFFRYPHNSKPSHSSHPLQAIARTSIQKFPRPP